jgi:hypothetical protein
MLEFECPQQGDLCLAACFREWPHYGSMPHKGGVDP